MVYYYAAIKHKRKCNDTKIFPLEKFNDDFCDCEDGSDENKTNACNNGKFYCNNYLYFKNSNKHYNK